MHGVKRRVKTTEEIERARKEAELQKIGVYKSLTSQFFSNRKAGKLDKETLDLSTKLLEMNPEFYSLWNYRREVFLQYFKEKTKEEMQTILEAEMRFMESSIQSNPKSYWVWLHREWVTARLEKCDWNRELKLCGTLLSLDDRNFHCWNYRRYAAKHANATLQDEFDFTTKKVEANFSNYSAWHQRSALLPLMYKDNPQGLIDALNKEFELVQNAFYTEPNDQSAWFYHRWLIDRICSLLSVDQQKETLQRELKVCQDLLAIEPNSKWAILTITFLELKLVSLGERQHTDDIQRNLKQLTEINPYHSQFYEHLARKTQEEVH